MVARTLVLAVSCRLSGQLFGRAASGGQRAAAWAAAYNMKICRWSEPKMLARRLHQVDATLMAD